MDFGQILKEWREAANLSQQQVAMRSGKVQLTQKQVSRIEQDPLTQNLDLIVAYLHIVAPNKMSEFINGYIQQQLNTSSVISLNPIHQGTNMDNKDELIRYLERTIAKLSQTNNAFIKSSNIADFIAELKDNLKDIHSKPILSAMGPSDAGKSTLLNYILGKELLPVKWQPATCLVTLLMHTQDKPTHFETHKSVYVLKRGFKPHMIYNPEMFNDHLLDAGGRELIKLYGEKDEHDEVRDPNAYMVVVFEEFPILENVWLLDTPGQLIEPEAYDQLEGCSNAQILNDKAKALSAISLVDGLIFASSTTKFMRDEDPEFLHNILMHKVPVEGDKPLANLIILKTHTYSQISAEENAATFSRAANHVTKSFSNTLYGEWDRQLGKLKIPQRLAPLDAEAWKARMQPFFRENLDYCQAFDEQLREMINYLLKHRTTQIENRVLNIKVRLNDFVAATKARLEQSGRSVQEKKEALEQKEARFRGEATGLIERFNKISADCDRVAVEDIALVTDIFESLCNEESMYRFIESRFDDKNEARRAIHKAVGNQLDSKVRRIIEHSTERFVAQTQLVVEEWQKIVPDALGIEHARSLNPDISLTEVGNFDANSAFIGGMAGLTSFGAMAGYVATISSNLGAYILVGKAAGVLTTLGITSSVTTLPALVAATGGPIAWGVALAGAIGFLAYKMFSNWKKGLAKEVVGRMRDSSMIATCQNDIERYWKDSQSALAKAVGALREDTERHIKCLYVEANIAYEQTVLTEAAHILDNIKSGLEGHNL
ncbi:dynamin family protein [Aeromonas rivipollensis]|uniref:Helix-turn-helix domain-containing protein n=1 Tax=Aeromonas rivipollensis TaxID=948519 RepID=A0AAW9YII3_9GAMM|nr:dynamin family protein [Aeromonas rivipollensis]NEX77230.1 helix-turn-helix domain-containing protein [Aeromonas rivipollensis]